jgi:Domain of unknown function (DUF4360)
MNIQSSRSLIRFAIAGVVMFCASGCAVASSSDAGPALDTTTQALTPVRVPNPNAPYFIDVTANGTGCPAGTWDASIAADGETFTLRFSSYEASLVPGVAMAVKDCQLAIKLHSPQGLSYSVSELFYSGYASLDSVGMTARQTARYYFQGDPLTNTNARTDMTGPFDDEFVYNDAVGVADLVWSACGAQRDLNVGTRMILNNNRRKTGSGYMNTSAVDGSISLKFRLSWRTC